MKAEHARSLHRLLDAVCRERRFLIFLQAPPVRQVRQFAAGIRARGDVQMIALHEQEVVGWCDIVSQTWPGFEGVGRLGMGVALEFRGQGVGEALARATIDAALKKGFRRIELEVYASNFAAIRLYEKLGFLHEGRKKRARFIDGAYDDIIQMALLTERGGDG